MQNSVLPNQITNRSCEALVLRTCMRIPKPPIAIFLTDLTRVYAVQKAAGAEVGLAKIQTG